MEKIKIWFSNIKWANIITTAITFMILICVFFLVFRKNTQTTLTVNNPTERIETRIQGKETQIVLKETKVTSDLEAIAEMSDQIGSLRYQLANFRQQRDTVKIIQYQDTLLSQYVIKDLIKDTIISSQRDIITDQRYIITSKDTTITILKDDKKKLKRQRNISLLVNGVLTGLLIIK